jgi:two-component system LytT family response regulator
MTPLRAFLVDDEPLAVERLARMLEGDPRVVVAGTATDPTSALAALSHERTPVDVVFLDIQMPGMTGLEFCRRLEVKPWIVFVTAYDQYALAAFGHSAVDYLLKPIQSVELTRALDKLARILGLAPSQARSEAEALFGRVERLLTGRVFDRIASRVGERIVLVELDRITHFSSEDRTVCAVTPERSYLVDPTLAELETRLEPHQFFRIHRGTLVNLAWVSEIYARSEGGAYLRLRDPKQTELAIARDRVRLLKLRLGV